MDAGQPADERSLAGLGERLRARREAVGLSVRNLAEQLGASRNTITNYEQGHTVPSTTDLVRLATALGCTLVDLLDLPVAQPPQRVAIRAHLTRQHAPDVATIAQKCMHAYNEIETIRGVRPQPPLRRAAVALVGPKLDLRIAATAERVREDCGFAELGPANIVQALENLGVRCVFCHQQALGLDAISVEQGEVSMVLLPDRTSSIERLVFSAAQELGHLVLHPELYTALAGMADDARDYEHEAEVFADSFLVPEGRLLQAWQDERLARLPVEHALLLLKERFRVGFWVLAERLRGMGLTEVPGPALTVRVQRLLDREGRNSRLGLEPQPLPDEALCRSTRFERLIHSAFVQQEIGVAKVAELLQLTIDDAKQRTAAWLKPTIKLATELPGANPPEPQVMKVRLWLVVENNSKFVRGRKKAREEIEAWVLRRYGLRATDEGGPEYVLTIPYTTDEELDRTIYDDIWREAEDIADRRHCFVEGDMTSLDDPERSW
mgnify:FL=1